jgi:hypothetical protein
VALEVDVEAVEAVGVDDLRDGGDEGVAGRRRRELDLAVLAADGDQDLLAGRLLGLDRRLEVGVRLGVRALGDRAAGEADVAGGRRGR